MGPPPVPYLSKGGVFGQKGTCGYCHCRQPHLISDHQNEASLSSACWISVEKLSNNSCDHALPKLQAYVTAFKKYSEECSWIRTKCFSF